MTKKPRIILASIWAPLALFLAPILILIPFAYPVVALLMAAAGYSLSAIGKLNLRNLLIRCGFLSLAVGAMAGMDSQFGVEDQIISFGIFSIVTMLSLSLGVFCWWFLAHLDQNKSGRREMPGDGYMIRAE